MSAPGERTGVLVKDTMMYGMVRNRTCDSLVPDQLSHHCTTAAETNSDSLTREKRFISPSRTSKETLGGSGNRSDLCGPRSGSGKQLLLKAHISRGAGLCRTVWSQLDVSAGSGARNHTKSSQQSSWFCLNPFGEHRDPTEPRHCSEP